MVYVTMSYLWTRKLPSPALALPAMTTIGVGPGDATRTWYRSPLEAGVINWTAGDPLGICAQVHVL